MLSASDIRMYYHWNQWLKHNFVLKEHFDKINQINGSQLFNDLSTWTVKTMLMSHIMQMKLHLNNDLKIIDITSHYLQRKSASATGEQAGTLSFALIWRNARKFIVHEKLIAEMCFSVKCKMYSLWLPSQSQAVPVSVNWGVTGVGSD